MLKKMKELKNEISKLKEICSNHEILQKRLSDIDRYDKEIYSNSINKIENDKNPFNVEDEDEENNNGYSHKNNGFNGKNEDNDEKN